MLAEGFAAVSGRRLTVRPALRRRLLGRDPGEDAVDAILALLAMVEVAAGRRSAGAPRRPIVRRIEGWILGLDGDPDGVPDPGPDDDPNAGPWRDPSAGRRPVPEAISSPAARR